MYKLSWVKYNEQAFDVTLGQVVREVLDVRRVGLMGEKVVGWTLRIVAIRADGRMAFDHTHTWEGLKKNNSIVVTSLAPLD